MVIIRNLQRRVRINREYLHQCLELVLERLKLDRVEIGILLVNDLRSKELNRTHRGKDQPTDVLSFPLYNSLKEIREALKNNIYQEDLPIGDVVVNLHQAERQANQYGLSLQEETLRLLIHGVLHLIGYDHEGPKNKARAMFSKQRELLNALKKVV
ncbi:MAG: rRNA maturation RNase YbeY [Nitrospirae bacterium]|nr:MAG: rRNA maturation RNase YbeY [Nitrospirota bacterium]